MLSHVDTYMGKYVTVRGIIAAPFKYTPVIRDDTAGIHLFAECCQPPEFNMGEIWTIRGKVTAYNNLTELKLHYAKDALRSDEKGEMPKPALKTAFKINESAEGLLVEVKNSTVTAIDSSGFTIQDETGEVYVYIKEAGFNTSAVRDGYLVDVFGIGQHYKHIYEVTVRNSSEIVIHISS